MRQCLQQERGKERKRLSLEVHSDSETSALPIVAWVLESQAAGVEDARRHQGEDAAEGREQRRHRVELVEHMSAHDLPDNQQGVVVARVERQRMDRNAPTSTSQPRTTSSLRRVGRQK